MGRHSAGDGEGRYSEEYLLEYLYRSKYPHIAHNSFRVGNSLGPYNHAPQTFLFSENAHGKVRRERDGCTITHCYEGNVAAPRAPRTIDSLRRPNVGLLIRSMCDAKRPPVKERSRKYPAKSRLAPIKVNSSAAENNQGVAVLLDMIPRNSHIVLQAAITTCLVIAQSFLIRSSVVLTAPRSAFTPNKHEERARGRSCSKLLI
ncbi:jg4868 [Pararge aegeria aegeria]|uniref:Jg4868 protein n=1 Tax=Pararge aegeria aegeria TaxID=348720 RepID=A0A8S4R401_9NEOP|nr:jg4868 [Pararge aegeria aegeria]